VACSSFFTQTFPANPFTFCCMAFHCMASDGRSWYYPAHMDFTVVTAGSCPEAQDSGVFSSTATRVDALDPSDPQYVAAKHCADIVTDPLHCTIWTTYLCGTEYIWRPDLTGYTIPDCGPFVGGAQLLCSLAAPGFPGVFNCEHLDTRNPRAGWLQSSFQLFRANINLLAKACDCGPVGDDGFSDCTWYYYDADCVLQTGGTYHNSAPPPCPAGTVASGCVCCRAACPACSLQCVAISTRCVALVDCCSSPLGNDSSCWVPIVPNPDTCAGDPYSNNDPSCVGYCGICLLGRDYRFTFCNGCSVQDDLQGCNPYDCPPDQKNFGNFVFRVNACVTLNLDGSYQSCQTGSAGDYIDWHCPATPEEAVMHRAWVLLSNGVELADALAATGATGARPFSPCRHFPRRDDCQFCHSVAYTPGYAASIDRRLAGEKTVSIGFSPRLPFREKGGIGTALEKLIEEAGGKSSGGCGCASLKTQLDNATPEGVEQNLSKFACQLRENAVKLGYADRLTELEAQARDLTGDPTLNVYEFIIRQAIDMERERLSILESHKAL
jgi:hypothetical protein